jgi:hypothetical protein
MGLPPPALLPSIMSPGALRGFERMYAGADPGTYSGVVDAIIKTLRRDGPLAFYSGARTSAMV